MATTVNNAFEEFLKDKVNLNSNTTSIARNSRDNLINNINSFSGDTDFFVIYDDRNINFGSFARKTKIRELDDIDIMICISGEGTRTYYNSLNCVYIYGNDNDLNNNLLSDNTTYLNSTKVINRYINKLSHITEYEKAEMHKNQEAATLQLKSYTWNFDIIPCFYTVDDFYLIPDGSGNWKQTDPRIDSNRTTTINQKHDGNLLNLIRIIKYWNNRKVTIRMPSYLLEVLILNKYEDLSNVDKWYIDFQFRDTILFLSTNILYDVEDPKKMQGNINIFNYEDRTKISNALYQTYKKSLEAINYEINDKDQKSAINKWRDIFGIGFPEYTNE